MLVTNTLLQLEIQEEIGHEGKNSKVNKAFDPQLNATFVVKKIPKVDFTNVNDFFSEAQILYAVRHPNIASIKYATQDKDFIYLTMDYLKKGSLNSLLNRKPLTIREILKYSLEFLSGLHYIHAKNLIHFDIKPTNILINDSNKAVITDFGLSKYVNEQGFAYPEKMYDLNMPLEALKKDLGFSFYTDIYQAALTIYRMCNGNNFLREQYENFNINSPEELLDLLKSEKFPNKEAYLPHIPVKLRNIINKALSPDPENRYETVLDMINDISLIDENLDWSYNYNTNGYSELILDHQNGDHSKIVVEFKDGKWNTKGFKVNSEGKQTRVTKWNTDGHNSKVKAFKTIERLLKTKK